MRIYQEGFELDPSAVDEFHNNIPLLPIAGWVGAFGSSVFVTKTTPHTTPNGEGGVQSLAAGVAGSSEIFYSPEIPVDLSYAWIGFGLRVPDINTSYLGISYTTGGFASTAKNIDIKLEFNGIAGIRVNGTEVAVGTTNFSNGWHWFALEYFCHPTDGFIRLYVDDNLEVEYVSQDTTGLSTGPEYIFNNVQVQLATNSQVDDIVINAATLHYTGGSSTPTIGDTVTGGTSSATAVITNYVETSAGEGYLVLQPNVGDTTSPTGFTASEGLSDVAGWTATADQVAIDANGLDNNSGQPLETYLLLLRPTSDISTQLTGQDGNGADNWENVDDDPFGDTATYNEGVTSGLTDVYAIENLPFTPGSVDTVEVIVYASRAGSIPGIEPGIDPGAGVTYGPVKNVGSGGTFSKGAEIFNVNPDTGTEWDETTVNASDIAVRLG